MKPGHIHPTTKSLEPLSDDFRFQMWRCRRAIYAGDAPNLLSKAHRAAHLARSFIGRAFYRVAQGIGLIALIAFGLLWLTAVDALINAPVPSERCFSTMSSGEYCRIQTTWSIGND